MYVYVYAFLPIGRKLSHLILKAVSKHKEIPKLPTLLP